MDRQQIGLKLIWEALGLPLNLETFAARLTLQKAIYLAQEAGVQLGYGFRWYIRGPYSPDLTRDAFAVVAAVNQGASETQGWCLDNTSQERIRKFRDYYSNMKAHLPKKLELLASVHFLRKTSAGQGKTPAELAEVLQRFGKPYSAEQVQRAITELGEHGLSPA